MASAVIVGDLQQLCPEVLTLFVAVNQPLKKVLTKIKNQLAFWYRQGAREMRGGKRPGAGRKPIINKRRIMFQTRWNDDEAKAIAEAAIRSGLKPSQFIRTAALEKAGRIVVNG